MIISINMRKPAPAICVICFVLMISGICTAKTAKAKPKSKNDSNTIFKLNEYPKKTYKLKNEEQKPAVFKQPAIVTQDEKIGLTVGIKAGSSAGLTGAMGDVTYSLSNLLPGTSLRGSVGYLTGGTKTDADTNNLKMATVNLDALYSIGAADDPKNPLSLYIGGGLIFPWKVNRDKSSGAWGAHAYLGSKYLLQDNTSIYGELAYSGIKYQAEEKALRGVEAMLGYSYSF